ncbi:VOC family protein [Streptomyces sp. NBC_00536]|uniref:VOC family protein n=1 Tax=Streptomyces sp. NBC_00536 TaxID=2975769 RepID=UPI002E81459C|nr:VOC family protein [Streptomyces sp. NBC_00536]WUC80495.1 VOC family protein [Streptomyces sp. NBC_00536]
MTATPRHLAQIVVDCREPKALVRFWARMLGVEAVDRDRGWSHVELPGGARLAFQPVPEEKAGKNRLHLDIRVDDIGGAVAEAVGLGAVRVGGTVTDDQGAFQTMRDPEGNEFCLVTG